MKCARYVLVSCLRVSVAHAAQSWTTHSNIFAIFMRKKWQCLRATVSAFWNVSKLSYNRSGNNEGVITSCSLLIREQASSLSLSSQTQSTKSSQELCEKKKKNDLHSKFHLMFFVVISCFLFCSCVLNCLIFVESQITQFFMCLSSVSFILV